MINLINVGMPHLGEESEGRRRVWVVDGEFDTCLEEITHALGKGTDVMAHCFPMIRDETQSHSTDNATPIQDLYRCCIALSFNY